MEDTQAWTHAFVKDSFPGLAQQDCQDLEHWITDTGLVTDTVWSTCWPIELLPYMCSLWCWQAGWDKDSKPIILGSSYLTARSHSMQQPRSPNLGCMSVKHMKPWAYTTALWYIFFAVLGVNLNKIKFELSPSQGSCPALNLDKIPWSSLGQTESMI